MEIRLSKIPYTNPFIIPQSVLKEICLFRNYANTCTWMHVHRTTFERNSSLGYHHLVWNGKTKHTSWKVCCPFSGPPSPRQSYRKIPKISPGTYIIQRPFLREGRGNLRFKIDWASVIVGRKFTVFALLYFVLEGNFQVQAPGGGGLYLLGWCKGGFLPLWVWGAYI